MIDNKLRDINIELERIISKAEKLKANKKYTDDERTAIIKALKKDFSDSLLALEYLTEDPTWRERAFEVQESFCLKAKEVGIIKSSRELEEIFKEIYEVKKATTEDGEKLKAIKKSIDEAISERDLSKLAHIWHDILELHIDGLSYDADLYIHEKLLELELVEEVENLLLEIRERAKEKRFRDEEQEIKNHEARLRKLEREQEKEEEKKFKKEYGAVSRRAGSYWKTVNAMYPEAAKPPIELESPGFCIKCRKIIKNELYYYEPKSGVLLHSGCAKEEFDKEEYKGKPELEIIDIIKERYMNKTFPL